MFRFFRRVRKEMSSSKRFRKYLGYAIGEMILVILGILIALQINNWNEERIEQQQIAKYAHGLIRDLEGDLAMAAVISAEINVLTNKIDALADYVENRPIEEMRNIDLFYLMRAPFYRPYAWNKTALEQIKNSGALRQMKNEELAAKISAYEAFTLHLEGDFQFDRSIGIRAIELAGTVVDMNYPNVHQVFPVRLVSSFSFPESDFHEAYRDTSLSLLTDDGSKIQIAVNQYLILGSYYGIRPRAEVEMGKLENDTKELIALLKEEYPE